MTNLKDTIREVFLAHGFTIKEGQTDLKPYVYEAVEALLSKLRAPVADERAAFKEWFDDHTIQARMNGHHVNDGLASAAWEERARRAALASAPVAGEARPTDDDILVLALDHGAISGGQHFGPAIRFARALLSQYAAPQASEAVRDAVARAQEWMTEKNVKAFPRTACAHIAGLSKLLLASGRRTSADLNHPVFAFLLGEGTLRGVEFGDRHPEERGAYWWRKDLRAALASAPVAREAQKPVAWLYRECRFPSRHGYEYRDVLSAALLDHYYTGRDEKYIKGEPLYAAPQASEAVRDAQDAARWRTLQKVLRTRVPGPGHGSRLKVVTTDPMYGDEKDVSNLQSFIDDCTQKLKEQS